MKTNFIISGKKKQLRWFLMFLYLNWELTMNCLKQLFSFWYKSNFKESLSEHFFSDLIMPIWSFRMTTTWSHKLLPNPGKCSKKLLFTGITLATTKMPSNSRKPDQEKLWLASPLTTVDNINKYRDKNHVIIGEEWG